MKRFMLSFTGIANRWFKLAEHQTTVSNEITAGITTFLTMSYIIFVNPAILHAAGMDLGSVYIATGLVTILGCILMGLMANYPMAIAPGMGLNVFFSYTVVQTLGYPWQTALGLVFISGVIFFLLALTNFRQWVIQLMPDSLNTGTSIGIGLFITFIGLQNAGIIIKPSGHSLMSVGDLTSASSLLFFLGFFIIATLDFYKIRGAIIIAIISITVISVLMGKNQFYGVFSLPPSLQPTFYALKIPSLLHLDTLSVLFTFILIAFFDATGTLLGVLRHPIFKSDHYRNKKLSKGLIADSVTTMAGAILGTTTTSPYIESAAGIEAGGRTGLTAITISCLFMMVLFISPLAKSVPPYAVAPALIYVGLLMIRNIIYLSVNDPIEFIPAIIIVIMIPATFSIADGLGMGIICYVVLKLLTGNLKQLNGVMWGLGIIFLIYFAYRVH